MLIVERQLGEAIAVGSDVVITVVAIRGNTCKLGIEAPEDVQIDRMEARARKEAARREAEAHGRREAFRDRLYGLDDEGGGA